MCRAAAVLVLAAVLTGCRGQSAAPAPTLAAAVPSPTVAATATAAATSAPVTPSPEAAATSPSPAPTAETGQLPEGWQIQTNEQLSIAIPPAWTTMKLAGEDAQTAFDNLKQNDARLAAIIGGPEALQGAAFWAFGPQQGEFVDNLNIRRSPLGNQRMTDLQQVVDVLLPEYDKMGLKVTSTDETLRVHKLPAARITYTMQMKTADGKAQEVRGRQVIVATDTDLWILSLSTVPEREGAVAADFERSAQSFEPK